MSSVDGASLEVKAKKHKKKKQKEQKVAEDIRESEESPGKSLLDCKKKKKKQSTDNPVENEGSPERQQEVDCTGEDSFVKSKGKKKKKKRKLSESDMDETSVQVVKKGKSDSGLKADHQADESDGKSAICKTESDAKGKSKKKKKRKHCDAEIDDSEKATTDMKVKETNAQNGFSHPVSGGESSPKKKKKKSKDRQKDEGEATASVSGEKTNLSAEDQEENSISVSSDTLENAVVKKKKKSKKRTHGEEEEPAIVNGESEVTAKKSLSESAIAPETTKSKKKKKKQKEKLEDSESDIDNNSSVKKKKKDQKVTGCEEQLEEEVIADKADASGKKSKKRNAHECISEINTKGKDTVLEISSTGTEEKKLNINSDRQGDTKDTADGTTPTTIQGQWQGNLFESDERQNKFLRLLGGMKKTPDNAAKPKSLFSSQGKSKGKGLFGSLASASLQKSNVALSATAAASLNKNLEEDYNRALNLKLGVGRGSGLGFAPDPAEGKKFHIDTKSVKSKVFDD